MVLVAVLRSRYEFVLVDAALLLDGRAFFAVSLAKRLVHVGSEVGAAVRCEVIVEHDERAERFANAHLADAEGVFGIFRIVRYERVGARFEIRAESRVVHQSCGFRRPSGAESCNAVLPFPPRQRPA